MSVGKMAIKMLNKIKPKGKVKEKASELGSICQKVKVEKRQASEARYAKKLR